MCCWTLFYTLLNVFPHILPYLSLFWCITNRPKLYLLKGMIYYFSWFWGLTGLNWVVLAYGLSCCLHIRIWLGLKLSADFTLQLSEIVHTAWWQAGCQMGEQQAHPRMGSPWGDFFLHGGWVLRGRLSQGSGGRLWPWMTYPWKSWASLRLILLVRSESQVHSYPKGELDFILKKWQDHIIEEHAGWEILLWPSMENTFCYRQDT